MRFVEKRLKIAIACADMIWHNNILVSQALILIVDVDRQIESKQRMTIKNMQRLRKKRTLNDVFSILNIQVFLYNLIT